MVLRDDSAILIAGQWENGRGHEVESLDPYDNSIIRVVKGASADDVDEAVCAGHKAMYDPVWRDMLPHERARILYRAGDLIEEKLEELARLQTCDNGKTITETLGLGRSAAGTFRYVAAALQTLDDDAPTSRGNYFNLSVHEPIGVIGAITPWNSPLASDAQKLAPALAAGNAVVLKPSPWSPLVSLEIGKILIEAGIPRQLISVLPGSGPTAGQALVEHPLVKKVSFTGGTETGRIIGHVAAEKIMPVSLELGGKSPTVVYNDADIDLAVRGVLYGIFSSQGQACVAGSRLFVQADTFDSFLERLIAEARRIRIGDPKDEATQMGPLITRSHLDSVDDYVRLAEADGGTVLVGGRQLEGPDFGNGNFYPPTIISGLDGSSRVCREEIFGPVLVAMRFEDEADLVRQANDSDYGLACGIWTADYKKAWRTARAIDAGTVWINTYKQLSSAAPFGGTKHSGLGREKGRDWIHEYMVQKSLYWGTNETPFQWTDL